jgi:hypothetical protein
VRTVCELVIAGRDQGTPIAVAEEQWAAIAREPHWNWSYMQEYCDGSLRIKAREKLDEAIDLLETFERPDQPGHCHTGAFAVLARLVREDAARAAQLAEDASSPSDGAIRLQGMAWWTDLPDAALPVVEQLMKEEDAYVKLSLVRILAGCAAPPPFEIVHLLRQAERHEEAERMRERLVPTLEALATPGQVAPLDLFDVVSASSRPAMAPWRKPPGLPFECP